MMKIGESTSLETFPFYHMLKEHYSQPFYYFVRNDNADLEAAVKRGEIDLAPITPMAFAADPKSYLILPGVGIGSRGPNGFSLLFTDMLLDDLDEMTVSVASGDQTAAMLIKIMLGKYLQYNNNFESSWAKSDAHVLTGDSALRERNLSRYSYIYDLGELWRYYTNHPMIFYMWTARADAVNQKRDMLRLFHKSLRYCLEESQNNWDMMAEKISGYQWMNKQDLIEFWQRIDYCLTPEHYEGLKRFYQDASELGLIEYTPELELMDID